MDPAIKTFCLFTVSIAQSVFALPALGYTLFVDRLLASGGFSPYDAHVPTP